MSYSTEQLKKIGEQIIVKFQSYHTSFRYYKNERGILVAKGTPETLDFWGKITTAREKVSFYKEKYGFSITAHLQAVLSLSGRACCSELSVVLVKELMETFQVKELYACMIVNSHQNHNFNYIISSEGQKIIIDPFFKIADTWDNYFNHPTLRAFFRVPAQVPVTQMVADLNLQEKIQKSETYFITVDIHNQQAKALCALVEAENNPTEEKQIIECLVGSLSDQALIEYKSKKYAAAGEFYYKIFHTIDKIIENCSLIPLDLQSYKTKLATALYNAGSTDLLTNYPSHAKGLLERALGIRTELKCSAEQIQKIRDKLNMCEEKIQKEQASLTMKI